MKEEAKKTTEGLVERFHRNLDVYKGSGYNETQVRREFIDPFFDALGWDVANRAGYAEQYKDVVHEDSVKVGVSLKAPDYSFRIGGQRKFFLEAKRPSVSLKDEASPAYQLRRYAWSAKLPLSILTDFEELAVYDCRLKPAPKDRVSAGRIAYYTYDNYIDEFDGIYDVFSKEAVLKGSFDRYVVSSKGKRGTGEVDREFLKEIESWRDSLARNLAVRNRNLTIHELNFAVQHTIDRIIFLRICEDRGIENYGRLQGLVNGQNVYRRLLQLFNEADTRYNSGLFDFKADTLSHTLVVDDRILKTIIENLYYPNSPYEFSVLGADILGNVYEQFLGKVIRLTAGHQAKVEEKPEVKKAGGVYYTPRYIVEYIVKSTVGKLLGESGNGGRGTAYSKGGTPNDDSDISGSGSLAGSNVSDNRGVPSDSLISQRGDLRTDQPDSTGGGLGTGKYSGRTQPEVEKRVSSSCLHSKGFTGGVGDTPIARSSSGVPDTARDGKSMGDGTESGASGQRAPSFTERNRPTPDTRRLTPNRVAKLKVLDPACGSGSFLLGAYQYLLDWHLAWYRENNPEKHAKGKRPVVYRGSGGEWRLTTQEKKRILLTNIYGVDIDRQAVEVTKLSLLLKVLEDENQETLGTTLSLFKERALPDLRNNIKCGNSLIGPDFYDQMELGLGDDEIRRINVFDWNDDERGFGEIMKNGGFDAVIGNPPYVRQEIFGEFKPYLQSHYKTWHGSGDLYVYFIEKAVSLLKEDGHFSYIVANKWMRANYGESLRRWMKEQAIEEIIDFGDLPVFQKATTYPCILRISRGKARIRPTFLATKVKTLDFRDLQEYVDEHSHEVSRAALDDSGWSLATEKEEALLSKIRTTGVPLDEYVEGMIFYGIKTGLNAAFVIDRETRDRLIAEEPKSQELIKPFLMGRDIKRYAITNEGRYLILIPKGWTREQSGGASNAWRWFSENYPAIANHLLPFREKAEKRYDKGEYWWELRACEYYKEFEKPKIIIPSIVKSASYTYDDKCFYSNDKTSIIAIGDKYLLGLLNSKVLDYFIHSIASTKQGGYFEYKPMYVSILPIRTIDFDNPAEKAQHDKVVSLVDRMLDLNKKLQKAKIAHERELLERQIKATDNQIDRLVYELYGLTEEEIKVVEG